MFSSNARYSRVLLYSWMYALHCVGRPWFRVCVCVCVCMRGRVALGTTHVGNGVEARATEPPTHKTLVLFTYCLNNGVRRPASKCPETYDRMLQPTHKTGKGWSRQMQECVHGESRYLRQDWCLATAYATLHACVN